MTATMNGPASGNRTRRSLNDSIARLDQMLDGLAEAIPETIRDELRAGVGTAVAAGVRDALVELLSSEGFCQLLRDRLLGLPRTTFEPEITPQPQAAPTPTFGNRLQQVLRSVRDWWKDKVRKVGTAIGDCARGVWNWVRGLRRPLGYVWQLRKPLLFAFAAGVLVAVATLYTPEWLTALLGGIGGAACAVTVQLGLWVRRLFGVVSAPAPA